MGLWHALLLLRDIAVALTDVILGRARRRYEHWIEIDAPREVVWHMLRAPDVTFDGVIPLRVQCEELPGRSHLERIRLGVGPRTFTMLTRIVEIRETEGLLMQILPNGTDPELIDGTDDYVGLTLHDKGGRTWLGLMREMTVTSRLGRITVPLGLRSGARRYKRTAETLAHKTADARMLGR